MPTPHAGSRFDDYRHDRIPLRPGFTLAEAIRKGAAQHRQCFGHFFERHPLDGLVATCVTGAAMVGLLGAGAKDAEICQLFEAYPELTTDRFPACPADRVCTTFLSGPYTVDPHSKPLHATLAHLQDTHRWSREQCADWLEVR